MHHPCMHIYSVFDNRHNGPQPASSPQCFRRCPGAYAHRCFNVLCREQVDPGRKASYATCLRWALQPYLKSPTHPAPGEPLSAVSSRRRQPFHTLSIILKYYICNCALGCGNPTAHRRVFCYFAHPHLNAESPSIYSSSIAAMVLDITSILLLEYPHVLLYFAVTRRLSWVWPCSFNPTG